MRIGIDGAPLGIPFPCGTKHYAEALLRELSTFDHTNEYFIFGSKRITIPEASNFRLIPIPQFIPVFKRQFFLGRAASHYSIDVFHYLEPYGSVFFNHPAIVTTVHDVALDYTYPWFSKFWLNRIYTEITRWGVLRQSKHVIAVSSAIAQEGKQFLRQIGSPAEVTVVHQGIDKPIRRNLFQKKGSYFLGMGDFAPRKNLDGVLAAYARLGERKPPLILVVSSPRYLPRITALRDQFGLTEQQVKFEVEVTDERLSDLYGEALAFLYPSKYEGFGLPILEAMAAGCPVITADRGATKEVAGDAAILVDPELTTTIQNAMARVLEDSHLRNQLVQRGFERAQQFTWEATARKTLSVYMQVKEGSS